MTNIPDKITYNTHNILIFPFFMLVLFHVHTFPKSTLNTLIRTSVYCFCYVVNVESGFHNYALVVRSRGKWFFAEKMTRKLPTYITEILLKRI